MQLIKLNGKPIAPSKVVCIGRNYIEHIKELKNQVPEQMVVFAKPNSAIGSRLVIEAEQSIHYEGEIAFVVIAGQLAAVGFGLDLTKRELQSQLKTQGLPWERAKAFDNSAIFSDFVEFDGQAETLTMTLSINDQLVQQGGCEHMLYKPKAILQEVKSFMSFEDGDVVMTGTPKGVGPLIKGDHLKGKIFQQGRLLVEANWLVK